MSYIKTYRNLNKSSNVIVISVKSIDTLFDILLPTMKKYRFQTRKGLDFQYWCVILYMHKYGYFYLDEGRNLTTKIARYINKSRYSNRKLQVEAPVIDPSFFFYFYFFFEKPLPIIRDVSMSHRLFSLKMRRATQTKREIWIYENDILLENSPFTKKIYANKRIGLPPHSRVIPNYIDTNKKWKNRYLFKSKKDLLF